MSTVSDHGGPLPSPGTEPPWEPPDGAGGASRPSVPRPLQVGTSGTYWLVISRAPHAVVVSFHGSHDVRASGRLGAILTDLIVGQGNLAVTVDLSDLGSVDAASVEVFAAAARAVEERGGTLAITGPPDEIVGDMTSASLAGLINGNAEHGTPISAARVTSSRACHPAGGELRPNDLEVLA